MRRLPAERTFLVDLAPTEELRPAVISYIQSLEKAGAEIATSMKLSETTESLLGAGFYVP